MGFVPLNGLMRTFWTSFLPNSFCTAHSSFPSLHIDLHVFLSFSLAFFNWFAVSDPLLSKAQPPSLLLLWLQGLSHPTWALVAAGLGVPWPSWGSQGCPPHTPQPHICRVCFAKQEFENEILHHFCLEILLLLWLFPRGPLGTNETIAKFSSQPLWPTVSSPTKIFLFHCHDHNFSKRPINNG